MVFIQIEEIQCQSELADLIPHIEEANMISIAMDKKIRYKALPVLADARLEIKINKLNNLVIFKLFFFFYKW